MSAPPEPRLPQLGQDETGYVRRLVTSLYDHLRAIYGRLRALQTNISVVQADADTKVDAAGGTLTGGTLAGTTTIAAGGEIVGDWSNATTASRCYLQTSTANSATGIPILPSGTGTATAIRLYNNSAPASGQYLAVAMGASSALVNSTAETGTPVPLSLACNGKTGATLDTSGNLALGGNGGALATTATTDFPCVPTCAGAPTGAFTPPTGFAGMVVDTTNNRVYFRYGGNWKYAALT